MYKRFVFACLLGALSSCASNHFDYHEFSAAAEMDTQTLEGGGFLHFAMARGESAANSNSLRVYLSGDGTPWFHGKAPSLDPTPKNPLALQLMALDPSHVLYIGRPCYHGLGSYTQGASCGPLSWTHERYSQAVVQSTVDALNSYRASYNERFPSRPITNIELVGYSGGAAIAVLMAEYIVDLSLVVTVAGNLDINRWVEDKGYLPLKGSLNPLMSANLQGVQHVHLVGEEDTNILPEYSQSFVSKHGGIRWLFPEHDHACCWAENWPGLLSKINLFHKEGVE